VEEKIGSLASFYPQQMLVSSDIEKYPFPEDEWVNLAFVLSKSLREASIFMNGVMVGSRKLENHQEFLRSTAFERWEFGKNLNVNQGCHCQVKDIILFRGALWRENLQSLRPVRSTSKKRWYVFEIEIISEFLEIPDVTRLSRVSKGLHYTISNRSVIWKPKLDSIFANAPKYQYQEFLQETEKQMIERNLTEKDFPLRCCKDKLLTTIAYTQRKPKGASSPETQCRIS
jgi:hypothetical protein